MTKTVKPKAKSNVVPFPVSKKRQEELDILGWCAKLSDLQIDFELTIDKLAADGWDTETLHNLRETLVALDLWGEYNESEEE